MAPPLHQHTHCNFESALITTCSQAGLAHHSLLFVGQMYDSGCAITFTSTKVTVTNGATIILTGQRDKESGMWRAPLGNSISTQIVPEHYVHTVYEQKSIEDTITYLHACYFSPVQDTWLKAIQNGHFATWSSVTVENNELHLD
jgi:hypothetical protein